MPWGRVAGIKAAAPRHLSLTTVAHGGRVLFCPCLRDDVVRRAWNLLLCKPRQSSAMMASVTFEFLLALLFSRLIDLDVQRLRRHHHRSSILLAHFYPLFYL